jgi:hypothetical protein
MEAQMMDGKNKWKNIIEAQMTVIILSGKQEKG